MSRCHHITVLLLLLTSNLSPLTSPRSACVPVGQGERQPGGQSLHARLQRRGPGIRRPRGQGQSTRPHWSTGPRRTLQTTLDVTYEVTTVVLFVTPPSGVLQELSSQLPGRRQVVSAPGQLGDRRRRGLQRTQRTAGVPRTRCGDGTMEQCVSVASRCRCGTV